MNQSIYPLCDGADAFPVYLVGVGLTDLELHNNRPLGYYCPQFIYTHKGQGRLLIDNTEYILTKDDCLFLPANYPHEYYPIGKLWETHWITFSGFAVEKMLINTGFSKPIVKKVADGTRLEGLFRKMFVTLKTDKMFGEYSCCGLVTEYIVEAYKQFFMETGDEKTDRSRILMPVLNYIEENLHTDISLDDLCSLAEVSPQHLCRVFQEIMQMRPVEYISKKRIQKAKGLLENTDMSIAQITSAVGYSDPSYFGAVFKRYELISPTEYRKIHLK